MNDSELTPLWSSILSNSLSAAAAAVATRSISSKNIIIIGDYQSGKTTIFEHLKQQTSTITTTTTSSTSSSSQEQSKEQLALNYSYFDIRGDDDDEIVARVGIYQLAAHVTYSNLVQFGLNSRTIADSLIVLLLDWNKPWSFVETLQTWFKILEKEINQSMDKEPELMNSLQKKVETFVRSYEDPGESENVAGPHNILLPLGKGCLVTNLGVSLVVVCTKSDAMTKLERDYKEEQFDFIQQTLRTICLKYGASLFYISNQRPETLSNLKSYILYRLLFSTSRESSPQHPFTTRAQVVERDIVFIPTGWDTWGKIRIIKESFDCSTMAGLSEGGDKTAKEIYENYIRMPSSDIALSIDTTVPTEDEHEFLERIAEQLQAINPSPSHVLSSTASPSKMNNGISHTANLPGLTSTGSLSSDNSLDDVSARLAKLAKRPESSRLKAAENQKRTSSVSDLAKLSDHNNDSMGGQPSQNEVLANFFQNLLNKKSQSSSSSASYKSSHTISKE